MKLERYELKAGRQFITFEFLSEGPKGKIEKIIQFTPVHYNNVYNLAFGDKRYGTQDIDDLIVTNNEDSQKVLATVVAAIYAFAHKHPDAWIYAIGSTESRTRLYRQGINKYYDEVKIDFDIYGQVNGEWEPYKKDTNYEAFVAKIKKSKFEL